MLNYIVLGQVPGTDYYLNFTNVLMIYCVLLFLIVIVVTIKRIFGDQPESFEVISDIQELSFTQFSVESSHMARTNLLTGVYTTLAVWLIIKYSGINQRRLRNYLSISG